jgi:drug/metabolite transporter (DMT)-like permease
MPAKLDAVAPFAFVLMWSSSFIAAKVGLRHFSPLAFVAFRLVGCGIVLALAMLLLRRSWAPLRRRRWLHCAIAGVLVNGVGLMPSHVGLTMVGAAPLALVQSLNPLLTAGLAVSLLGERLRPTQWLGLALGVAGVALVVGLEAARSRARLDGLLLGGFGVLGICGGTLYFGRYCRNVPLLPGATAQFLAAGAVSAVCAVLFETPRADWTASSAAALTWNTAVVSLGGMALYFFMLSRGSVARAAANFYLIPGTAAVLAWALLGEKLQPTAIAGFLVASAGCWLVNRRPQVLAPSLEGRSQCKPPDDLPLPCQQIGSRINPRP